MNLRFLSVLAPVPNTYLGVGKGRRCYFRVLPEEIALPTRALMISRGASTL